MVYTTDGITLTAVRYVIITAEGRTRRIMNPTREQCLQAGVDAYEYSPIPCPETPEGEEGYYNHAYIIDSEVITDQWTWVPTEPEAELEAEPMPIPKLTIRNQAYTQETI